MSTLYLVQQGTTVRKVQSRFVIQPTEQSEQASLSVPIRDVDRLLVFGNIHLTTSAISSCLESHVPVMFLTQTGRYKGHLWSAEQTRFTSEIAQFSQYQNAEFQLEMARSIVRGKLLNSKQFLLRLNRKRKLEAVTTAIAGLNRDLNAIAQVDNLESLRGYEGIAASRYFSAFGALITGSEFRFEGRNRRPPTDPVNSMLSFGYTLLFNNVLSLILTEGLHPYLGNLHRSDRAEPHLAFDLMEEFRSAIVDSLVMTLVNRRMVKPDDFQAPDSEGGVYLTDAARRSFLKQFETRMETQVSHPRVQDRVSYRYAIQLQIRQYQRCVMNAGQYVPFLRAV